MKRIINFYIIREISSLFMLGIVVFTLVLLMGRMIKLTEMVVSRGIPLLDVCWMIIYLMPSFLIYTIPMAFLLAVLLTFGRLSSDNEFTVMKACGISLVQIMPPVLLCGLIVSALGLYASTVGVPWGNQAFSRMGFAVLQKNVSETIREKVFWDDIPGIVLYTDHYDEARHALSGVLIYDGRDRNRPLTIFAASGVVGGSADPREIRLELRNGSIHVMGKEQEYRLINYGSYIMTIHAPGAENNASQKPWDMQNSELRRLINDPATSRQNVYKMSTELHTRYALPFASLAFAVLAVPLGLQNRRSAKAFGFSISIGVLLLYYIVLSLMSTLAEKGTLPALPALWLPNLVFLAAGWWLLKIVSRERNPFQPLVDTLRRFFHRAS